MNTRREMIEGVLAATPAMIAAAPFGLLFGALAVDNGLSVFDVVLMSAAIFGGASQMVGIDLFGDKIAPWLIVLSIFAVNFRHVLYSAVIGRHTKPWAAWQRFVGFFFLIDPQFAIAETRAESGKPLPFDLSRAHRLYKTLFDPVADLIKGKQLLIVPSGPLTQLLEHVEHEHGLLRATERHARPST